MANQLATTTPEPYTAIAKFHEQRAIVLAQPDPLGGEQADHTPIEPLPSPTYATVSVDDFEQAETLASQQYAQLLNVEDPSEALLWASLSAASKIISSGGSTPAPPTAVPSRLEPGSYSQALDVLFNRQEALIYGLESMIGTQEYDHPLTADMINRVSQVSLARDETVKMLTAAKASASPAPAHFDLPGDLNDVSQHQAIWAQLEQDVAEAWARVFVTTEPSNRQAAFDAMCQSYQNFSQLSGQFPSWPGWR